MDKLEGGATGGVEELYREVILDHFKAPKNRGPLPTANTKAEGMNPLCGDQITISALVDGGKLKDVKFEGHGCAISQSAASMMTQVVKGKSIDDVKSIVQLYKSMFGIKEPGDGKSAGGAPDALGDLVALEGVKKYPVRIKCAILSANTLIQSIDEFLRKKGT